MKHASTLKHLGRGLCAAAGMLLAASGVQAAENFRMGTLAPGTSNYIVLTTFANIVNEKLPEYRIQINSTGAGTRHIVDAANKRTDFFMHSPTVHEMMKASAGPFARLKNAPELAEELRAGFNFLAGYYHILTFADSGIDSLEEIKGKRVFLGPPGSAAARSTSMIVEGITGYKPGEDFETVELGWSAAAQSFQDGHIDVYFNFTLPPSPVITQIALTRDLRLLDLPQEKLQTAAMQKLLARPGFRLGKIPADAYGSGIVNEEDVTAVEVTVTFATHKDVPDEVIYKMTKAFWENIGERSKNMRSLREIKLEKVFQDLNMPMHPGALRYYEEIGLDIPAVAYGK